MKSKLLLLILGLSIAIITQAQNTTIAYEGFDYPAGKGVNGKTGGTGWGQAWVEQNADTTLYEVQTNNPTTFTGLFSTPGHLSGPQIWQSCWRLLDVNQFSSFLDNTNNIGASGTTLYYSMLLRKDVANTDPAFVLFSQNINWANLEDSRYANAVALGFLGNRGNVWSLRVGSNIVDVAPLQAGVSVFLVAKFTFGATNTVDVYVNPVISNGEPATSQGTASSTASISFTRLGYLGGYGTAGDASIDEIRFGNSFTAIAPASASSGNITPVAWGINGSAGTNPLINYLGTPDNNDLNIRTNNVNRITIAKTGEVTINSLNGTGSSLPAIDATGKLSRIGNGTAGQYLQYTANGPAWGTVNNDWAKSGFFDTPTNSWLGLLSNTWTQKVVVNADVTEFNSYVTAWQGISVGSYNKYTPHNDGRPQGVNDIVNGAPWYGIALLNGSVNGLNFNPVQIAGYQGIVFVDNTASAGPAMKIQNGNVGIATAYNTALNEKFTVNGNIKLLTTGNGIIFPDGTIMTTAGVNGGGSGGGYWNIANSASSSSYACNVYLIYSYYDPVKGPVTENILQGVFSSTYDQTTVTGNSKTSCVLSVSGTTQIDNAIQTNMKVGIGTTSPVSQLQVVGDVVVSRTTNNTFAQGYGSKIYFGYDNGQGPASEETNNPLWLARYNKDVKNSELRVNIGSEDYNGASVFSVGKSSSLSGFTPWIPGFTVDVNGNTTIAGAIRIGGKVLSQDIRVTNNPLTDPFPDYVFLHGYKLMSLRELDRYVSKNKHLPEIPSAKEIKREGGFEVGKMNILLLKKLEELTLLLIKEHKRNNKLEKEVSALKVLIKK